MLAHSHKVSRLSRRDGQTATERLAMLLERRRLLLCVIAAEGLTDSYSASMRVLRKRIRQTTPMVRKEVA